MSLTGPLFLGAIVVCTVVAFVVLILRWPMLAGHGPGRIAARTGMLLTVNVWVLLTAATQLHAQFSVLCRLDGPQRRLLRCPHCDRTEPWHGRGPCYKE